MIFPFPNIDQNLWLKLWLFFVFILKRLLFITLKMYHLKKEYYLYYNFDI